MPSKPGFHQLNVQIPLPLFRQVKAYAGEHGIKLESLVLDAITQRIATHAQPHNFAELGSSLEIKDVIKMLKTTQQAIAYLVAKLEGFNAAEHAGAGTADYQEITEEMEGIARRAGADFEGGVGGIAGATEDAGRGRKRR